MSEEFTIYPAIDILEGKCVRLLKGDYSQETVYNHDPVFVAKRWASLGAKFLHIIDLDGAKDGEPTNLDLIKEIRKKVDLPIQLGGGIRNYSVATKIIDAGIDRIILGSAVTKNPEMIKRALGDFGEKVVVGMDCRNGKLAFEGWTEDSDLRAIDVANELKEHGLSIVNYTDINRDGTMEGPNIEETTKFAKETGLHTIASGGVSNVRDVELLEESFKSGSNIRGVIIGKALYTGGINPDDIFKKSKV